MFLSALSVFPWRSVLNVRKTERIGQAGSVQIPPISQDMSVCKRGRIYLHFPPGGGLRLRRGTRPSMMRAYSLQLIFVSDIFMYTM